MLWGGLVFVVVLDDLLLSQIDLWTELCCLDTVQVSELEQGNCTSGTNDILQRSIQTANLPVYQLIECSQFVRRGAAFNTRDPIFYHETLSVVGACVLKAPSYPINMSVRLWSIDSAVTES